MRLRNLTLPMLLLVTSCKRTDADAAAYDAKATSGAAYAVNSTEKADDFVPDYLAEANSARKAAEAVLAKERADQKARNEQHQVEEIGTGEKVEVDCTSPVSTVDVNFCSGQDLRMTEADLRAYLAVARLRFVDMVNDDYNKDSAAQKKAAIAELDESQAAWEKLRDAECGSVYYKFKEGTIVGWKHNECLIQLTRLRTRLLWQNWLQYMDSTPPILPKPRSGFEER